MNIDQTKSGLHHNSIKDMFSKLSWQYFLVYGLSAVGPKGKLLSKNNQILEILEGIACYAGQLRALAEGLDFVEDLFFRAGQKSTFIYFFFFRLMLCLVVTVII